MWQCPKLKSCGSSISTADNGAASLHSWHWTTCSECFTTHHLIKRRAFSPLCLTHRVHWAAVEFSQDVMSLAPTSSMRDVVYLCIVGLVENVAYSSESVCCARKRPTHNNSGGWRRWWFIQYWLVCRPPTTDICLWKSHSMLKVPSAMAEWRCLLAWFWQAARLLTHLHNPHSLNASSSFKRLQCLIHR